MVTEAQQAEIDKYHEAYKDRSYAMGRARKTAAQRHLDDFAKAMHAPGVLIDVGCGRGEMLDYASSIGFMAFGVDPATHSLRGDVSEGWAWNLPFDDNDATVVTCFDVMEHLLSADHVPALEEMKRVSSGPVIIAAADFPHEHYHVSYMRNEQWQKLFESVFDDVSILPKYGSISRTWLCRS